MTAARFFVHVIVVIATSSSLRSTFGRSETLTSQSSARSRRSGDDAKLTSLISGSIQLAALLPIADRSRPFSASKVRPAADLAINHVKQLMLAGDSVADRHDNEGENGVVSSIRSINVTYGDSDCSEMYGMKEAIQFYTSGPPSAFFGPVCDYALAPVARQAKFWNIPVLSTGGISLDFGVRKRSHYPLLTRVGPVNGADLAYSVVEAMRKWNWRRVTMLYERSATFNITTIFCHLIAELIMYRLRQSPSGLIEAHDYFNLEAGNAAAGAAGGSGGAGGADHFTSFEHVLEHEVGLEYAGKCCS